MGHGTECALGSNQEVCRLRHRLTKSHDGSDVRLLASGISALAGLNGGNISILANQFFQSQTIIDASAPFGLPGTVQDRTPELDLSAALPGFSDTNAPAMLNGPSGAKRTAYLALMS